MFYEELIVSIWGCGKRKVSNKLLTNELEEQETLIALPSVLKFR